MTESQKENDLQWPPDYAAIDRQRLGRLRDAAIDPEVQAILKRHYANNPADFINDWMITYDPRAERKTMPFILFPKQVELVEFLHDCFTRGDNGLIEKSRDMGATWLSCGFSIWAWLFVPGSSVGWGSRKELLVDRLGDSDSIFEKMRMIIYKLPIFFMPEGFIPKEHMNFMKIINPETGASITGEAGDNIGRGGRTSIYFKDESAWYLRPDLIEASLGDNTEAQIDISSVNGTGNIFYRKRKAGVVWEEGSDIPKGKTRVFIMDWRDHPGKNQEWYDRRRRKAEEEGLLHLFAQEVDRDYASAVVGVVIPAAHVRAAIDAHIKLGFEAEGLKIAGLDVADEEGADTNALATKHGVVLQSAEQWGGLDTSKTATHAVGLCQSMGIHELYYDSIGVGAGVRGETNRINEQEKLAFKILPWNAALSGKALPDAERNVIKGDSKSPKNKDFYASMKAMAWWSMRTRFEKTYKAVTQGAEYPPEELISIPSGIENRHVIEEELSQATWKKSDATGKIIINKQPNGMRSPNIADAIIMAYFPPVKNVEFRIM